MILKKNNVVDIISSVFILLFVYTAINKFVQIGTFRWNISQSPLIASKADIVAWTIPSVEVLISIMLFMPKTRKWGLYGSLILMLLFTIYVGYMILFATHLPCSCGGVINKLTWNQHLWLNVFLTSLAAMGIWLQWKQNRNAAQSRSIAPS